jgi:GMP synthase (glutamine-hydrolysing)
MTLIVPVVNVRGQYNHLIARMFQELGAKSELIPMETTIEDLQRMKVDALAAGGGPQRIREALKTGTLGNLPVLFKQVTVPLLCICVTHQLLAEIYGGESGTASAPEFGPVEVTVDNEDQILAGMGPTFIAWGSHNDEVTKLPPGFVGLAHSENCKVQAMRHETQEIFGVQFHPEVSHTVNGRLVFRNFLDVVKR